MIEAANSVFKPEATTTLCPHNVVVLFNVFKKFKALKYSF
jgi:hypothetical protein